MKYTEKQLNNMASPISQSEEEKCKNAIKMIRDAMKELNYTDDGKLPMKVRLRRRLCFYLDHKI